MLISETHMTSRSTFKLSGYTFYDSKDPRDRSCGGSAILIKSRIKHHLMGGLSEPYIQATNICIEEIFQNLAISSIYCPPRYSITKDQYNSFFKSLGPRFIAAGDYNAKHTYWGSRLISPRGRVLYDSVSVMGLNIISSGQPTYWPTDQNKIPDVIDFGVTKGLPPELFEVQASLDLSSDHSPTIVTICSPQKIVTSDVLLSQKVNWLRYRKYISAHCSHNVPLKTPKDIDDCLNNLNRHIAKAAEHASFTYSQTRYNKIYSANVEQLLTEKRRARREWQKHRSPQLKAKLKACTNHLRNLLEAYRSASLKAHLESLDNTPQTNYSLWRSAKRLKRPVIAKPPLRNLRGSWARNDEEKSDLLASHLKNVFTPNTCTDLSELPPVVARRPIGIRFQFLDVLEAIDSLNAKKAPGFDQISNKMLLELPFTAKRLILFIFNAIIRLEHFPPIWKVALVKMIPKPGKDPSKVESYRPISLLPTMSKLFEKLLKHKLTPILNDNDCIPNHQFGFRSLHSTIEQTHRVVQVIRKAFEEKKYCSALFIDVSQAFDKVWHDGLLNKLKINLPINLFNLLEKYITGRHFMIKEGNYLSSPQPIGAGVPQGSILGPILYLIYTADMPTNSFTQTSTFADDTAFLSTHKDPIEASNQLQHHVAQVEKWANLWGIKINEQKCTHVTFTLRKETCSPILINNQMVPQQFWTKYLGIHLDRRLTWKSHIDAKLTQMKLKVAQIHWLIGRNSVLRLDCKLLLYNSILKPIWCYGIQLWGTASASNIEKIQRRQNKILRMITGAPWYVKNSNIHKDLQVPLVKCEILNYVDKYLTKLETHPNPLARNILQHDGHTRLKKKDTIALRWNHWN